MTSLNPEPHIIHSRTFFFVASGTGAGSVSPRPVITPGSSLEM